MSDKSSNKACRTAHIGRQSRRGRYASHPQHDLCERLRRLFLAVEHLRQMSYTSARDRVVLPRRDLDILQRSLGEMQRRAERVGLTRRARTRFAAAHIESLTAIAGRLARQRYQIPNWTAQVAMIWLRLRALAMILTNIVPETAGALSLTLTEQPPAWPSLNNVTDVQLVPIPPGLAGRDHPFCPPLVPALSGQDQPNEPALMTQTAFDIIGIGFGPANIAFAAALEERRSDRSILFLEKLDAPSWQPGMLLSGSDIQNNPLRDLVTPRNPRSRYSFINFLHEHGRLFQYLNLGVEFPLRKEYAHYVTWVARQFDHCVRYGREVTGIDTEIKGGQKSYVLTTARGETFTARSLVVAPGRTPLIPPPFDAAVHGERVFHLTRYLSALESFQLEHGAPRTICVVGGSQSAVELMLDLSARFAGADIVNIQRGYGFALKDTSPFSGHVYFPEHVDYYFGASAASKAQLDEQLKRTNYSAADADVIRKLYLTMYEQKLDGAERIRILANTRIGSARLSCGGVLLELEEVHRRQHTELRADIVILATGFRNLGAGPSQERVPPVLMPLADNLLLDDDGVLAVARDYRLRARRPDTALPPVYLNGLCETTHGMGDAGSFSLLSLRSECIAQSLDAVLNDQSPLLQAS
jgi:L-ornithine N5-oxygenase